MKQKNWDDVRMRIMILIEERIDELESIKNHEVGLIKYGKACDHQHLNSIEERIGELRTILKRI